MENLAHFLFVFKAKQFTDSYVAILWYSGASGPRCYFPGGRPRRADYNTHPSPSYPIPTYPHPRAILVETLETREMRISLRCH